MIKFMYSHAALIIASVGLVIAAAFAYSQYQTAAEIERLDQKICPPGFICHFSH